MKTQCWLWSNRNIGKVESRRLREEHNAVVNLNAELLEALQGMFLNASCPLGQEKAARYSEACEKARAAIAKAQGD